MISRFKRRQGEASSKRTSAKRSKAPEKANRRRDVHQERRRRGWWIMALALVLFVVLASAVTWRRSQGIIQTTELNELARKKAQLEAEQARLEALIRDESSRSRLTSVMQAAGMNVPSDSQVRFLPRRAADETD